LRRRTVTDAGSIATTATAADPDNSAVAFRML